MIHFVRQNLYLFYTSIFLLFISNTYFDSEVLGYAVGILAIPMLLISFMDASKLFRILGSLFIIVGFSLFLYSELPFYNIPLHMTSTMPLLTFLSVLPWMNSVVRAGRFDRRINSLMNDNVSNLGKLYVRSSFTTYLLITFINLSALPLTQDVLQKNMKKIKKRIRDSFISRTTLRAFAVALAWSPMEIIVAITVDTTGVSYLTYLPWLFLCSVLVLFGDWIVGKRRFETIPFDLIGDKPKRTFSIRQITLQILQLFLALFLFLILVILIGNLFHLNFILSVTIVIIPFAIGWSLMMRRWHSFKAIGWHTWKSRTNRMQNFVVLFLSLAFFSSSLNKTSFLEVIQQPFIAVSEYPMIILLLIQMTYLLMSMIGVHPIATIGVLIEVVKPLYELVNPLSIGMVLVTGAIATATVGTYGVTVTMTAMNTQQNPYRITLRNMPFALFYGGVGTFIGCLLL